MRLAVFSDIHLEARDRDDWKMKPNEADVVVLAGDIHTKSRGVDWAKKTFSCPVIYVPGNHEGWGGHWENTIKKMKEKAHGSNVHVLNNESIVIDGVRFICSTLWTCFSVMGVDRREEAMFEAGKGKDPYSTGLRDYKHIRTAGYRRIKPMDVYKWNAISKSYIENELSKSHDGPSIVVSHHAPLGKDELYGLKWDGILDAGYYNDMLGVIKKYAPQAWIFGHTHIPVHKMIHKTAIISHPMPPNPYVSEMDNDENDLYQYIVDVNEKGCNVNKVPELFNLAIPMDTVVRKNHVSK